MKEITVTGKTVDEALYNALQDLGREFHEVDFKILQEGSKGFLGLGSKEAKILVWEKDSKERQARQFLTDLFQKFEINVDMNIEKTKEDVDQLNINLKGKDVGLLIGKRGQTLDAIQYLASLVVNKTNEETKDDGYTRVILDIDGYRKKREEVLINLAKHLADKAKRTGRKVILEPMNPQERRIIHTALQDHPDVYTYSEGDDPYRNVVIDLKD